MIKETSKMKTAKKLVVLMVVLAMVFALSVPAFATGETGHANVKFVVPKSYSFSRVDPAVSFSGSIAQPRDYSTTNSINYYYYSSNNMTITLGTTTMYDLVLAVATARGELATTPPEFVSGYDNYNLGWYISKLSGLGTETKASYYSEIEGESYWAGLGWMSYAVPNSVANATGFNPLNISSTYLCSGYTSNTIAQDGFTYFMVYEPSIQIW